MSIELHPRGQKPHKIIYYRDGVSEGQFEDILNLEMTAIQRACKELPDESASGYQPGTQFQMIFEFDIMPIWQYFPIFQTV